MTDEVIDKEVEEEETAGEAVDENVEFAVLLIKTKTGDVGVKGAPGLPEAGSLADVKATCQAVIDSINASYTAQLVAQQMVGAAMRAQQMTNRTEGGLVIPGDAK